MGFIVNKPELINITLSQEDYQIATTAYNERLPVTCTGDLIKDKDIFLLVEHHSFALYPINTEYVAA